MEQYSSSLEILLKKWKTKTIKVIKKYPDRTISLLSLIFTCILSLAALKLAFRSNNLNATMLSLAKHADTLAIENIKTSVNIQSFKVLLKKTDSILSKDSNLVTISSQQIDKLVLLNQTLNNQLTINRIIQKDQTESLKLKNVKDILEFKNLGQELMLVVGYNSNFDITKLDSLHRDNVFNRASLLLDKALENPLAFQVDTILRDLIISKSMIGSYHNVSENEKVINYTYNINTDSVRTVRKGIPEFNRFLDDQVVFSTKYIGETAYRIYKYASILDKKYRKNWVHTY